MKIFLETEQGAVSLNPFVERLLSNVLWAILTSLHLPGNGPNAEFTLHPQGVTILVSGKEVPLVNDYVKNTLEDLLRAILKNLKGVSRATRATFRLDREA